MIKRFFIAVFFLIFIASFSYADPLVEAGKPFPELNLKIAAQTRQKAAVSVPKIVVFFTSWSKSSGKEIDNLLELDKKFGKKIDIAAVSFDNDLKTVSDFIKDRGINFTVFFDEELFSLNHYQILVIPTTFIVKADGTTKNIFVDFDDNVGKAIEASIKEEIKTQPK